MRRSEALREFLEQSTHAQRCELVRRRRRSDLSLEELLEPDRLATVIGNYGRRHGASTHFAAVAGQWSKQYFAKIMRPVASAAMLLDWRLPFSLDDLSICVSADGDIISLGLSNLGRTVIPQHVEDRFDFLLKDNISEVVRAIAKVSGLSRNVLWSNAGNVFEGLASSYVADRKHLPKGVVDAFALLDTPFLLNGSRNPIFSPIVYSDICDQRKRKRRVCCIRFMIDGLDYCATCPCPIGECAVPAKASSQLNPRAASSQRPDLV
ncbi:siderophore-iron reductase FhuF [Agrobacterium rosae]|uniref:Siderophore-iron reductase FhuF n=1 Tax=Agrobacterium rosae TaxID=1972867 RepID=A0AAW9FKD1_9HYPH|nr:siderophore-iron reductase FhuF [Agrobacterium rosae]MDX8305884.1 siderophore-iron reductase FhuF [Agrobacterium rosae]MDX8333014.1 siderophore-iron reductase FhuF [Agrobacterium rosae]